MNVCVPCAVCGAEASEPAYPVRDLIWAAPEIWEFVTCAACGHGYLNPQPDGPSLGVFYEDLYTPENLDKMIQIGETSFEARLQSKRIDAITRLNGDRPVRRILDVGCGVGIFAARLRDRFPGSAAIGVEVAGPAADRSESVGVDVRRALFSEVEIPLESVDVLTMNHYLEHEPDPASAMRRAASMVTPGGIVEIEIPWLGGWGRRLLRRWYWGHLPPQHLHFFSREGLTRLMTDAGLEAPEIIETRGYPMMLTVGLILWSRFTFGSESPRRSRWWIRAPLTLLGLTLLPLTILLDLVVGPLMDWSGRGDILMVAARKPDGVNTPPAPHTS